MQKQTRSIVIGAIAATVAAAAGLTFASTPKMVVTRPQTIGDSLTDSPVGHVVDKGGHFAQWEQPELFSSELRKAFKSLR